MSAPEEIITDMVCRSCGTKWVSKHAKMCPVCSHGTGRALRHIKDQQQALLQVLNDTRAKLDLLTLLCDKIDRPFS
jgi:ribosomal protein L37E